MALGFEREREREAREKQDVTSPWTSLRPYTRLCWGLRSRGFLAKWEDKKRACDDFIGVGGEVLGLTISFARHYC